MPLFLAASKKLISPDPRTELKPTLFSIARLVGWFGAHIPTAKKS
jgi:hypothetical protein